MIEALRPSLASLKVQLLSAGTLPLLAGQLPAQTAINLLQGDFVQRQSAAVAWQAWRWAAGFAAALLVVHWAGQVLTLRQLKTVDRALDQRIEQVVASALPGEAAAANGARARMQTRLDQLRASADDGQGLLPLLASVAAGRAGAPGTQLQSLAFRRGSLDLTFNGPDAGSIEQINQSLRGAGLSSELTAGAVHGSDYQGRLQVRTGGK
jgi:type II secretion system protein L